MSDSFEMRPIARIRSDFGSKFGVLVRAVWWTRWRPPWCSSPTAILTPCGAGGILPHLADLGLSPVPAAGMVPPVRPPRLGQSAGGSLCQPAPLRPNPIGLSSVRLDHIAYTDALGPVLHVRGADLVDGTPSWTSSLTSLAGTATRRPPAAASEPRVPRWRWKSHPPCWINCRRTGGRPLRMCWPWIPVPGISRTRTGCTASLRRAGGEIHRGWRPPAGRGHQMNARHPGYFRGARLSGHQRMASVTSPVTASSPWL